MTPVAPQPQQEYIITEEELVTLFWDDPDASILHAIRSRPHTPSPQVPTSAELIHMAKQDWINRYMRKGTLDEFSFETGWMAGFLTPNKPDWSKEHDAHIRTTERNATLDEVSKRLQKKTFFNGITWCISNSDIDEVLELIRTKKESYL